MENMKRGRMKSSIKNRWVKHMLSAFIAILLVAAALVIYSVASGYYSGVRFALSSRNNEVVQTFFSFYTGEGEELFYEGAREFVDSFNEKSSMEVWVINSSAVPVVSSSGFNISESVQMPDYKLAAEAKTKQAFCRYKNENGESVLAMTFLLNSGDAGNAGAVRYIVSLEDINSQLIRFSLMVLAGVLFVIALIAVSGFYFVSSIVRPVRDINETAKRISHGDFSARIGNYRHGDEIDELCITINEMAEQIGHTEKIKNEFISTISHEIRTPLTAIRGWGETINELTDSDDPVVRKGMQVIISETQRLSGMVEDLLDFSRMQNGSLAMKPEMMDVIAELDESCLIFRERAEREDVELIYNSTENPVMMRGDANRIRQVFINILDNALKYNNKGGKIRVDVDIRDRIVVIYIQDSGCGIPERDLARVKEKFYRANYSVHGSGIGLAVADEIVKKHNGELKIESMVDLGTTVTVTLPLAE